MTVEEMGNSNQEELIEKIKKLKKTEKKDIKGLRHRQDLEFLNFREQDLN